MNFSRGIWKWGGKIQGNIITAPGLSQRFLMIIFHCLPLSGNFCHINKPTTEIYQSAGQFNIKWQILWYVTSSFLFKTRFSPKISWNIKTSFVTVISVWQYYCCNKLFSLMKNVKWRSRTCLTDWRDECESKQKFNPILMN